MIRPHYITPPIEDSLPLFARARASDPATSHAAAARTGELVADHMRKILDALAVGPAGASTIAARCGLLAHQVNKRLPEMTGILELTGRTVKSASGRGEREWRITAASR